MKRLIFGIAIWLILISTCVYFYTQRTGEAKVATNQLTQFLFGERQQVELKFSPDQVFKVGDTIFIWEEDFAKPVGIITRVDTPDSNEMGLVLSSTAYAVLYPNAPVITDEDFITYHSTPDSLGWVVEMMLPPEKRKEIGDLIVEAYKENEEELTAALQPIIRRSIEESIMVIGQDLRRSLASRSERIQAIGNRLQVDLVKEDIVPLIQREIWPVIEREAKPVLNQVGSEIWQQASLWRFGWRYLYDFSPLPRRDLTRKEFDRFVRDHAVPVLENHVDDFMDLQRRVMRQVSENRRVQKVVSNSVREFLYDPEVRQIFGEIFQEVIVKNQRLQDVWKKNWSSNEARKALALTNERMEPTITKIGESLFGNPTKEITPEFSWALRSRVLRKDSRWLSLVHHPNATAQAEMPVLPVLQGADPKHNPFFIPRSND